MADIDYTPTREWFDARQEEIARYNQAKTNKEYMVSDYLRTELLASGIIDLDSNPRWHPVFESVESRSHRLAGING